MTRLVVPSTAYVHAYARALERGWSPDNARAEAAREHLAAIASDARAFVEGLDDAEGRGPPITLPDGSVVKRLPHVTRWMWDAAAPEPFVGMIGLRWQAGTAELPPTCPGHIGYAVTPWHRGRGHATRALASMLDEARAVGLPWVMLTTNADNPASARVIVANGGRRDGVWPHPPAFGPGEKLRWVIDLS